MTALVEVSALSKHYPRVPALTDVSFSVRSGEILGLLGPNGAGKTTLFECLAGIQPADRGTVRLAGGIRRRDEVIFYVPDGITPWAEQPVGWVLEYVVAAFGGRRDLLLPVVDRLGLRTLLDATISTLSKGQRKRVLLAVGMLTPQPLLLVDEPFEGLDLRQAREVSDTLRWHVASGRSLFLSIHQISHAARFCDRLVLLSGGRVCAEGTPLELATLAAARSGHPVHEDFEEVFLALT